MVKPWWRKLQSRVIRLRNGLITTLLLLKEKLIQPSLKFKVVQMRSSPQKQIWILQMQISLRLHLLQMRTRKMLLSLVIRLPSLRRLLMVSILHLVWHMMPHMTKNRLTLFGKFKMRVKRMKRKSRKLSSRFRAVAVAVAPAVSWRLHISPQPLLLRH